MTLSALQAANQVGRTRQAIIKAIRKGTISANKNPQGEWRIEPSELFRVYEAVNQLQDEPIDKTINQYTPKKSELHTQETEFLKKEISYLKQQIDDTKKDKERLLNLVERQTLLIAGQQKKGFLKWLLGDKKKND